MAVQAQYPSNVLFLNRSAQEGKNPLGGNDYSLQPQPGGGRGGAIGGEFLDQSHHLIFNSGAAAIANNNNNNNPRKRDREVTATTTAQPTNTFMSMHIQPQTSQLIDLTQLHTPHPNVVSTGLRLAFGDNHRQQQQQNQQQRTLSSQSSQSSVLLSLLSEDLATQIKQQGNEIEHFLQAQGEQMRRTLAEKRHKHYGALLRAAEESMMRRLMEKEADVEKVVRRNAELEARAAQLSAEAQAWQARAREQEATATTLQVQLQQAMMSGGGGGGGGAQHKDREDTSLRSAAGEAEDAESAYIDPERVEASSGPSCKACRKRVASVVVLPCRHLCVCTECDAVLQACPICLSFRSSSVEVFFG